MDRPPSRQRRVSRERDVEQDKAKVLQWIALVAAAVLVILFIAFRDGEDEALQRGTPEFHTPTSPLEPAMDAFLDHWNGNDLESARQMIAPDQQSKLSRLLDKVIRRRKWQDQLPQATRAEHETFDPSRAYYWADIAGYGRMRVNWEWETKWVITRFKFEKAKKDG